MYSAKIENSSGEILTLTGNEPVYQVIDITGLNPPRAQINTSTIAGLDGAVVNSTKLETRNIVITVRINGNVEANRLNLYNYFRTKENCTFYYKNGTLDVYIPGYCESVECGLFSSGETAQISIVCPYPYFKSVAEVVQDFSAVTAMFEFPFSIDADDPVPISDLSLGSIVIQNDSESATGAVVDIVFEDSADSFAIMNSTTGEGIKLDYPFKAGDKVTINTNKGQKSITLIQNGVIQNLFGALQEGSAFFQLAAGSNTFEYLVGNSETVGAVNIVFRFNNEYKGV